MRRLLDPHLDAATLRALALDPEALRPRHAAHLAGCARCQSRAGAAARGLDGVRAEAHAAADAAFSAVDLDRQHRAILGRIARAQRPARVLPFPSHDVAGAPARADRRWLAAAAAAGLVLGALAGQLPHLNEWTGRGTTAAGSEAVLSRAESRPIEDTLLSEVAAALDPDVSPELGVLDALTPVHYELR